MTPFNMYFLVKLDSLIDLFIAFNIIFGMGSIVLMAAYCILDLKFKWIRNLSIACIPMFFIFTILIHVVPTTKQMCAIVGIPMIVNNESVQEVAGAASDIIKEGSQAILREIRER